MRRGGWTDDGLEFGGRIFDPDETYIPLPPVSPSEVVCVGLNYRDHAAEPGSEVPERPMLFLKPQGAELVVVTRKGVVGARRRKPLKWWRGSRL